MLDPVKFDLTLAMSILERTPTILHALLWDLPSAWTTPNEGPDTWSPFDVVGHLIDGEETDWVPRALIIVEQGQNRRFEPFDRFRHLSLNEGRRLDDLLERFAQLRGGNLTTLRDLHLTPAHLALTGEHPDFGTVTLEQLLATWVTHDLGHLAQISRVMAKQYRDAVGPWSAYIPILHR